MAHFKSSELVGYRREGDDQYEISDAEMSRQRRRVGMVFQRFNLFPHKAALENIMEGPAQVLRKPVADVRNHAKCLLFRVGLGDKAGHYPSQLSGITRRVGCRRASAFHENSVVELPHLVDA